MSLVSRIAMAINTDDTDQSERLIDTYHRATPKQQEAINDVMICLCGWTLPRLIEQEDADADDN